MRRLCLIVGISAMLSLSAGAQQKDDGATKTNGDSATNTAGAGSGNSSGNATDMAAPAPAAAPATTLRPAPRNLFALPEAPRPTPFPAAASDSTEESAGKVLPRYEVGGGYSYVNFDPGGGGFNNFNGQGGTIWFTYNAARWLGLNVEGGDYGYRRDIGEGPEHGGFQTYLFGPRLNLRKFDHFVPFLEWMIGGLHADPIMTGANRQSSFAMAAGGGVDIVINKWVAWRFMQADYLMTSASGPDLGGGARQNNFRIGSGIVIRWGIPNPPPPAPKGPPVAACSASPASVYAGSNDAVAIHVNASSPDSLPLTYAYTASGGTVEGTGPDARWNSSGLSVGSYSVTAKVDDGKGGTATCVAPISVEERPHHPPTISCSANPSTIQPGEKSTITSTASSPDNLDLTYSYSASAGQVTGNGPTATWDSTGLSAGSYKVNCSVTDSRGDKADSSANVDVQQPPPPPQATKIGECGYTKAGVARFDNLCKRVGDDVALRLKNDPTSKVVIIGYADPKEPKAAKLAQSRADLAKAYLGEKGIDASRSTTRTGQASTEKGTEKENRRVEFIFVPEGATY